MAVTTSLRSWNDYNAFEQMQRRFPNIGFSIVFTIGFLVFVVLLTCISGCFCVLLLSAFSSGFLFPRTSAFLHPPLPYRVLTTILHTTCGILCWSYFSSSTLAAFSHPLLLKLTWPRSRSLVTLLLIYAVTGTIAQGPYSFHVAPLSPPVASCSFLWLTLSLQLLLLSWYGGHPSLRCVLI